MKSAAILLCTLCLLVSLPSHAGWVDIAGMGPGHFSVKTLSLKEQRFRTVVRQQYDFSCGSAALATLLTYHYQNPVSEQMAFKEMYDRGNQEVIRKEGFSLLDIKRYLEANGYLADGYEAPLDKLAEVGIPAIALISDKGYNHFVVIKGIRNGQVLIGDPSIGSRIVSRKEFEQMWTNRILFVIRGKQDKAIFNAQHDWRIKESAPLRAGFGSDTLANVTLLRPGRGDF